MTSVSGELSRTLPGRPPIVMSQRAPTPLPHDNGTQPDDGSAL